MLSSDGPVWTFTMCRKVVVMFRELWNRPEKDHPLKNKQHESLKTYIVVTDLS
jgi:hypothetical protein